MKALPESAIVHMLTEQFIPDNLFIYVAAGCFQVYDGNKTYTFKKGDACLARKNKLAKYAVIQTQEKFEPILFCFDEPFLREFEQKYPVHSADSNEKDALIIIQSSEQLEHFIASVKPYYKGLMPPEEAFEESKYQELLLLLLKLQPELCNILFDYRKPGKSDLEKFMNQHYKFNVSLSQFAYLTGRSLSAFKRDFKTIFNDTPAHWLLTKRLDEAYFLIVQKHLKAADIYIETGFENITHFYYAFKKRFGKTPKDLMLSEKKEEA